MTAAYTGGCQCGAVRYRAAAPRDRSSVCFCRMCQRASGAPFMAFVRFRDSQVTWSNPPRMFASSSIVERGFCASCGTPLSYKNVTSGFISLTIHSLDDPQAVTPELSFSAGSQIGWCDKLNALRAAEDSDAPMVSYQYDPKPEAQDIGSPGAPIPFVFPGF